MVASKNHQHTCMKQFSILDLKYIAIIAMVIDHITVAFLRTAALSSSPQSVSFILYAVLRGIGRLTMPLMVFCLVEGFTHTRNLRRYLARLFVFAVISHFAFVYFNYGSFFFTPKHPIYFQTGIIAALFFALLLLTVLFKTQLFIGVKILLSIVIFFLSFFCDWTFYPLLLTLIFYLFREHIFLKIFTYILSIPFWIFFNRYTAIVKNSIAVNRVNVLHAWNETIAYFEKYYYFQLFMLGLFLVIPFIALYNGKKTKLKNADTPKRQAVKKYFFYIFYPAHLIVLGWLKTFF